MFSLWLATVTMMGFFSYYNLYLKYKHPITLEIFLEHYKELGPEFAHDLYSEIMEFDKTGSFAMIIYTVILLLITAVIYFIQVPSDEIKTYLASIIFGLMILILFFYDLKHHLNNSERLKKYGYSW